MTNKSISDAFARNKTHTVAAIAEAKEESNRYTDTQVISVKSYSDTNLASAKTYTNESIANYEEVQSGVNVQLSNQISQVDNKVEQLNQSLGSAAHQESEYFTNYADGAAAGALSEANKHAEEYADGIKDSLLNGAGDAYDTLKELGELIDDNTDAIGALEIIATNKADKVHEHSIADITDADKKVNSPIDNNGNPIVGQKGYTLLAKGDGTTEWVYYPKIYIGSEEMPEGYDIKLDPNAPALELDATLSIDGAVADAGAVGAALSKVNVEKDWNQNDETAPDYVKNRTHYIDPVDFEWSGTVNFTDSNSMSYPSGFWYRYELATLDKTFNCCTLTIGGAEFTVGVEQSMWNTFSEKSKVSFGPGTVCLVFSNNTLYMFSSSQAMNGMGTYSISNCGKVNPIASVYLPSNVSLAGHTHGVSQGGTGCTSIEDTTYTTARYRASSLHSSETTPTINGTITWTYE